MQTRTSPLPVLRGAAHLLTSLPFLLGYTPERSLVLCGSWFARGSGGGTMTTELAATFRLDLPDDPAHADAAVAAVLRPLHREAYRRHPDRWADGVWDGWDGTPGSGEPAMIGQVFLYDADDEMAAALLAACHRQLPGGGVAVHDVLLVREGRYLPLVRSGDPGPAEVEEGVVQHGEEDWEPVPAADSVPAVADLVLEGRNPSLRRDDLVSSVRVRDEVAAGAASLALDILALDPARLDEVAAARALAGWVAEGEPPSIRDRAWIGVTLADRWLRDLVLSVWLPEIFPGAAIPVRPGDEDFLAAFEPLPGPPRVAVERLVELSSQLPLELTPAPLTLAGALAWSAGDGTLANELIRLVLERDPDYRMAALLDEVLRAGISPRSFRDRRGGPAGDEVQAGPGAA